MNSIIFLKTEIKPFCVAFQISSALFYWGGGGGASLMTRGGQGSERRRFFPSNEINKAFAQVLLFMLSRKDVHSLRLLCRSYSAPVLAVFHSALLPLPEEPRVLAIYREPHFLQTSEKLNFVAMPRKAPFLSNTQKSLVSS